MAGEAKRTYATKELDAENNPEEKKLASEQFNEKASKGSPEHFQNVCVESQTVNNNTKFVEKEKDNTQQREAVIRPQQAGKIDFKSLQNRSNFASDRTWPNGKVSPQSPSGKSRIRDKGKKSGKAESAKPQQLCRLSTTNSRSNPTIGIAYPQQKLSPPKKLEASRGPVSGSYRFHVPNIPEREAELQQEEFNLNRFQEGSNLISPNYTSQVVGSAAGGSSHQHPATTAPQQQPGALETNNTQPVNQMLFPDFQLSGADMWQSPDRAFSNASFGVPSQKSTNVVEVNKPNSFVPLPFQYGYPLLDNADSFPCDQNPQPQDLIEASLGSNQVIQNSFSFQTSGEEHEVVQSNAKLSYEQSEDRQYSLHSKPPQYVQTSHAIPSSVHCTRNIGDGVSNSDSKESNNQQPEKKKGALSDKSDNYCPVDSRDIGATVGGKRGCHSKNSTSTQRILVQGSVHHIRNIAQSQVPQIQFSKKNYNSSPTNIIHVGSAPLDKNNRVAQPWEGPNKAFPLPLDQNSTTYPFQCQPPLEQRQNAGINSRMPWQQIRLTAAMPNQNRIELSRQLSNQQMAFLITPSDWKEDSKSQKNSTQKNSNEFPNNKPSEAFSKMRQDSVKQGCSTISPCQFTNKLESSQNQVGDAKNKSLYFAVNHAVHGSTPRTPSYPPLHGPSMELMMVSPYDSPSHSPMQNQMASSTCSSLSPDSTSPASSSSDDSQKASPSQFYNQAQSKASLDNLSSNQHHYHSDVSHSLRYNQEKSKDNIVSFSSNIRQGKSNVESGKGCLDSYGMEQRPPPPYSAHQLLASSLATANLDQLDVLLTCKQCDQNFNNLASFLDHKQYCGQHTFAQNDFKDIRKVEDTRKFHADHTKAISSGTNFAMSRSSSDLQMSLLGLNKNGEIMTDSVTKVESKDDPMKLMLPSAPLPDLEMEDAKLDSLITEALNGLGYQSDNAEIDSSFIDAFADDEITTTKCSSSRQTLKTKDSVMHESRSKHEFTSSEKSLTQQKYTFDADFDCITAESKHADVTYKENNRDSDAHKEGTREETSLVKRESTLEESNTRTEWVKETQKSDKTADESELGPRFLLSRKFSERGGLKTLQSITPSVKTPTPQSPSATRSSTPQKPIVKERKRKRISGGSWSKELIHKIVQQKNKLHKLNVKGTKNMQFSLVMERVTPTVQNPTFREYDYISDSDEDCEPVKISSQGRLSQSIRCKYTYTKECKGRIRADKNRESPWKQDKIESFELKKAGTVSPPSINEISGHQRVRRRSSRSSTSSELSTSVSVSSESISSPKSIDRTDSDCEKRVEIRKKDQESFDQERSPQRILKESSTSLALTFTKNTKHYSTDKILLSELKDSFTTSKCSNVISTTEETASEHTLTKSTVSLARFKTTRVEVEEKMDHYGSELRIAANTEEATPLSKDYKDYKQASMHLRRTGITMNSVKTKNEIKKDQASSKGKTLHKNKESHQDSESSPTSFDTFGNDISAIKETKTDPSDLFSEPPSLCSSLMDEVCLSSAKLNDALPQKDRACLMPYTLEHEQSLMKSPLSFDTTSMFDLTVGGFDNNLYPDIQLTKEGFSPMETAADKKELFESSFSPLLEQRDWSLMVDVTPELPDEIAQYKEDSDIATDKKTCFNPVPFTLTEKIMDYHPNLNACVSDDELEIKRIVTELESQLQSAKLSSPSPLDNEPPKHLTMSKFSPLRLDDHETESDQSSMEVVCPSESLGLAAPTDSHSELFSEPDLPWSSPVQFGLMGGQQCLHTPTHSTVTDTPIHLGPETLHVKGGAELNILSTEKSAELSNEEKSGSSDPLGTATNKSEEMIEQEIYTENLKKSLEVISDSLSSGLESAQSSVQQTECSKELEKENDDKTEKTVFPDESEKVDSRYAVAELTECSSDLNKTSEEPPKLISADICESNVSNKTENSSDVENNDVSLHDKDTQVNELQPASTCVSVNNSEESKLPPVLFDHKTCEPPAETRKVNPEPEVQKSRRTKDFNLEESPSNPNALTTLPDVVKDESTKSLQRESSQAKEMFIETNATKDCKTMLESASVKQADETEIDKVERARDNVMPDNASVLESIKSPHSEGGKSHEILRNDTDTVSPQEQSQMDRVAQSCGATLRMPFSDAHNLCGENAQIDGNEDPKLESIPPISPSPLVSPYVPTKNSSLQGEKSLLSTCWTNINIISPTLIDETLNFKSSADVDVARSLHTCESSNTATEINNSFASDLNFAETAESKISSPRTMLAVDSISKQPFYEANEKSEILDVTQNKDPLYEFKLSPMDYSETHFTSCSLSSETLNKNIDVQSNIKSSPKDSLNLNACALTLNTQLSSNCRLSPIHVQNELELTTYDHLVKLDMPHFHDAANQNDIKYCCISPTNNHHVEHRASDDTEQLSKHHQDTISTCHVPLDSIDYMDLNINLLRKTDAKNVESEITTFKLDALPQNPVMSNVQETPNPKERLPTGSISFISVTKPMMGQCTKQSEVKSSPKKGGTQNAVQGKFQCEICLMYFRTLPGLKRHKAMKHTVKSEVITVQKPPLNSQSFVPHPVDKELKDNMRILDPVVLLNPSTDATPVTHCDLAALNSVFEGKPKESLVSKSTVSNDKEDMPPIIEKAKKNNKVKRSKSMDVANEGFMHKLVKKDPFPDELLSILKTDILQAISPDFPTMTQPECPRSSGKLSTANSPNYQEVKVTEDIQCIESACIDEQEITALPKCPEMYHHAAEADNTTAKPEICASLNALENNGQANDTISGEYLGIKEICDPCEDPSVAIKSETMTYPTDESSSHCEGYKDPPISPSGLGTDLKDLFDDENTFSQLFPRNDEMKRKKCARVYGKSSKKQKQMLSLVSDYTGSNTFSDNNEEYTKKPDNVFASSLEEHCEYETISLDDAKMLEMCHKSTLKSSPQKGFPQDVTTDHQVGHEDTQEARIGDFLCHTEDDILQPAVNLNGSEDRNIDTGSDAKENCKSDEPCPLQLVCVQDNVPRYPSIDIQNFNTTFQLPEMPLFESERDMSVVEAIVPKKSPKKTTECRNRKRIETGLKPKDKQYKCKVCFTWFLTLGELDFHKLSHNPSPPPTCYMCVQRKFSSREQLRDHLREKHVKNKAGVWTCGMCLKEISDVWMYNEHLREHATQFARKGQSQSSLLDMPGCFMQENAVKNFISSIMQHQSKKSIRGENAKSSKEERKASTDVSGVEQKSSDTCEPETIKSKVGSAGGGNKHSIFTPLEVLPKADTTPKNVEMHPNCKDPSRDCHHCGKQFPKPFKLQRHLVVHNLQKIFMCHKCPVSYQQAKELKDHLKSEHEEVDEPDSKHTTLYTCELCADVMHVIKKSFICSTCNYTFSKKEQFDRHMEKHLAGGSKIFKFRGVVRPCKSKEDEFDMPANKKRKILPENSQENSLNINSIQSVHIQQTTDIQGLKPVTNNSCNSTDEDKLPTDTNNTSVKIEDVVEDLSGALEQHQSQMTSAENTLNTKTTTKEEDNEDLHMTHTHDIPDTDTKEVGTDYKASLNEICDVKVEDDCGATQTTSKMPIPNESNVPNNKMKEGNDLLDANEKECNSDLCSLQFPNQTSKSVQSNQTEDLLPNVIRLPSLSNEINHLRRDQINECASTGNENEQIINNNDQSISVLGKERTSVKSEENVKQCLDNSTKSESITVTDAAGVNQTKISLSSVPAEDKDCVKLKKRKDLKTLPSLPRTAPAVTRENLGIDPKVKKKFRSNKCERAAGQRKGDISADYPVLTSVKDEMTSNKIVSKHKTGTLDLQPKRGSDNFSPKKEELVRHLNWDCRGKKGVPGRAIHSATSKVSVTSMSNSFNKSRPKLGVKSVDTQSYHTAESHNSLLSKLFGQRLTGFKIPLRKDTSESIN
ncbi:zinc finger protein 469 [Hemibagrus wyckioides]|uniref:zinc finger protein 469 n=1 Tax=Hemibagrus wyckioides TaxID=337641 RepID=UPI00266D06E2|nr:zinc finger protein 469 [Hemibagrus wyckioides]XP_058263574.1 zinc finger protein 469 [Hemibagrus wyckioides]XP_058263575.1 zinc finger protein 469 [Hemibagrus wyckioides]XP_058263576.1 zinc finger protein 469 [Hemibagrus wyckioides]XP_058263577.1 zinc finger protein 469 [Hemibagrus wyckioides]XP_058263578.1 zinc finger protein 469 [Hemibagrus wyckioides]XP_058263579.1 zinc finger protein 469 [Hemibagrus wyckioides]